MAYNTHYIPLEANPVLFTQFIHQIRVSPSLKFQDVLSIGDSDFLGFVPRPVLALILDFPTSDVYEEQKAVQDAKKDEQRIRGRGGGDVV